MQRHWAALALCLGLSSTAYAESGVPLTMVNVPAQIPSDGVLPLYGCRDAQCSILESVVVTDPAGTRVEGHVEVVVREAYVGWGYFVPSQPFRSGVTYSVSVMGGYSGYANVFSVSDADPMGLDEGALGVSESLGTVHDVRDQRCCGAPGSKCIDVSVVSSVVLTASLSGLRPVATQYQFELSMYAEGAAGTVVAAFHPLRTDSYGISQSSLEFTTSSARYCYMVRAQPIVGGEPFTLLMRCVADKAPEALGRVDRTPAEIAQWAAACEATPSTIDAGVRPVGQADAATDADGEMLGRGDDKKLGEEESGCRLSTGSSHAQSLGWSFALLALALGKRRRDA